MIFDLFNITRTTLLFVSVTIFIYFHAIFKKKKVIKEFPPGPFSLPLIGNFLEVIFNTHVNLAKLKEKYGNIFRFRLGLVNGAILSSEQIIKEAFQKTEFLGRPPNDGFAAIGFKSIFFSNNVALWKAQRGFVIRAMRDLGLGKKELEEQVRDEICILLNYIEEQQNSKLNIAELLKRSAANNIFSITVGKRFDYEDPGLIALIRLLKSSTRRWAWSAVYLCFPWLKFITPLIQSPKNKYGLDGYNDSMLALKRILEEHRMTFNSNNIRDFMDSYLQEIGDRGETLNFTEETLFITLVEIVGAGAETTSSCILWCIYMIAAKPDIKKKLLTEILEVVGLTGTPSMSDQQRMPYTRAFICEILRWVTIIPVAPLRYTSESTTLYGYDVPKNTGLAANLWAVHHDPEIWDDPHAFKPGRFLEDDGQTFQKFSSYIPFSIGKRRCPGEAMAHMEIFLYLTLLLQRFDLKFNLGVKPTFESVTGISVLPKKYPIHMISRKDPSNIVFL